jgi:hypothetical protein
MRQQDQEDEMQYQPDTEVHEMPLELMFEEPTVEVEIPSDLELLGTPRDGVPLARTYSRELETAPRDLICVSRTTSDGIPQHIPSETVRTPVARTRTRSRRITQVFGSHGGSPRIAVVVK